MSESPYTNGYGFNPAPLDELPELDENYTDGAAEETAEADLEIDGLDADTAETAENGAGRARTAAKPASPKASFRRVAAKALEVNEASATTRAVAAVLTGSTEDVADLTAAIMTAPRGAAAALADLDEVIDALATRPWEAGVIAASMDRTRLKAVWGLLHALEAVDTPAPPARADKAGLGVVRAANELGDEQKAELVTAAELLKRS
ncbi:hypothetical protein [Arthrobacter caoxuetaonis]|uniref:Uncharacterized protein n=1 Tax=Arthrobacter caoxuetaonis TaxID=2886935 RepID=A0A9X1MG58_9MICC|nr:hypothetical protein [Arthrobacter caoxuetaonis]MCC3299453.1 hypothetical protein [Arthrobacter caoxuetaonis]USQ59055.1 hypothetical protein NF551_18285 [Arthrobacter caoxuetaonis]